jgi:hypothetical protein
VAGPRPPLSRPARGWSVFGLRTEEPPSLLDRGTPVLLLKSLDGWDGTPLSLRKGLLPAVGDHASGYDLAIRRRAARTQARTKLKGPGLRDNQVQACSRYHRLGVRPNTGSWPQEGKSSGRKELCQSRSYSGLGLMGPPAAASESRRISESHCRVMIAAERAWANLRREPNSSAQVAKMDLSLSLSGSLRLSGSRLAGPSAANRPANIRLSAASRPEGR